MITVLGAGSWGTALAVLLAKNQSRVRLWGWDTSELEEISKHHSNTLYLPGIPFPDNLEVVPDLVQAIEGVGDLLIAVPSFGFADLIRRLKKLITKDVRIVWATKGLEAKTAKFLHVIVENILGQEREIAILSGPSFAMEVAKEMPTAVALASHSKRFAQDLEGQFNNHYFKVHITDDLPGVQLCGAIKNVLAIAVGIVDGLGYGANTSAALMTRGITEMTRLGIAVGGKPETFIGLAGLGDVILTCGDNQSRNRRFGVALGQGQTVDQAVQMIGQVVEGVENTEQAHRLAESKQIDMPICQAVYRILHNKASPKIIIEHGWTNEINSSPD